MLINGKELSEKIKLDLIEKTKHLNLKLAIIQVGNNEASNIYVSKKIKMANELNIKTELYKFSEDVLETDIEEKIKMLNKSEVDGIFIQLPISKHLDAHKLINLIDPVKDVDGLTSINFGKLVTNNGLVPCTPAGIMEMFKEYNIDLIGKNIVIIGKSQLVGLPLSILLLNEGATVTVCHSKTSNLKSHTLQADIIISAAGVVNLVTEDIIKEEAIVIDVGINSLNGKIVGDVDFENVSKKASFITPVPGGVGPMTVIMLMENVYKARSLKKD